MGIFDLFFSESSQVPVRGCHDAESRARPGEEAQHRTEQDVEEARDVPRRLVEVEIVNVCSSIHITGIFWFSYVYDDVHTPKKRKDKPV